ncbi:hypothetical protein [Methanolobus sp. ZRKC5]|uniref:hypothetical protein n=1 Tax=unclassified Methanolobus TaxID=2629569 RepID=UPI00313E8684
MSRWKIEIIYFLMIAILTYLLDSSLGINYLPNALLLFAIFVLAAKLLVKIFMNNEFFDIKGKITFSRLWRETNFQTKIALLGWVCFYYFMILWGLSYVLDETLGLLSVVFIEVGGMLISFEGYYMIVKGSNPKRTSSKMTKTRIISNVFNLGNYNRKLLLMISFISLLISFFAMGNIHPSINQLFLFSFAGMDIPFLFWFIVLFISFYIYISLSVHLFFRKINSKRYVSFKITWMFLIYIFFYIVGLYMSWYLAIMSLDLITFSNDMGGPILDPQILLTFFNYEYPDYSVHLIQTYELAFCYSLLNAYLVKRYALKKLIQKNTELDGMRYFIETAPTEKAKRLIQKIKIIFEKNLLPSESQVEYSKESLFFIFQKEKYALLYCKGYAILTIISGSLFSIFWSWHIYRYYMEEIPIIFTLFSFDTLIYITIPAIPIILFGGQYVKIFSVYDFAIEQIISIEFFKKYWVGLGLSIKLVIPWYVYSIVVSCYYLLEEYEQIRVIHFYQLLTLFILEIILVLHSDKADSIWNSIWSILEENINHQKNKKDALKINASKKKLS